MPSNDHSPFGALARTAGAGGPEPAGLSHCTRTLRRMPPFKIQYRRRGARKWLADPHRRFYGDRATAEGQITDADLEHWEVRVVEILGDVEPDYRARLQLEGHWEPTPWPETPALRWTVYLVGGREGLRFALYDTFSQERANHFAQTVIDMLLGEPSETHHRWSAYAS